MIISTAVYCIAKGTHVLLAHQQSIIVGLKGYGGKLKKGESLRECAIRETWKESGGVPEERMYHLEDDAIVIKNPEDLELVGMVDFYNGNEKDAPFGNPSFRVFFYRCTSFKGRAISTKEMFNPDWYSIFNLPIDKMIMGDGLIIPDMLRGKPLTGYIRRTKDLKHIIDYKINPLCTFEELKKLETQMISCPA